MCRKNIYIKGLKIGKCIPEHSAVALVPRYVSFFRGGIIYSEVGLRYKWQKGLMNYRLIVILNSTIQFYVLYAINTLYTSISRSVWLLLILPSLSPLSVWFFSIVPSGREMQADSVDVPTLIPVCAGYSGSWLIYVALYLSIFCPFGGFHRALCTTLPEAGEPNCSGSGELSWLPAREGKKKKKKKQRIAHILRVTQPHNYWKAIVPERLHCIPPGNSKIRNTPYSYQTKKW